MFPQFTPSTEWKARMYLSLRVTFSQYRAVVGPQSCEGSFPRS